MSVHGILCTSIRIRIRLFFFNFHFAHFRNNFKLIKCKMILFDIVANMILGAFIGLSVFFLVFSKNNQRILLTFFYISVKSDQRQKRIKSATASDYFGDTNKSSPFAMFISRFLIFNVFQWTLVSRVITSSKSIIIAENRIA